jgi:hypothetical protein
MHGFGFLVLHYPHLAEAPSSDYVHELEIGDGNGFNHGRIILEVSSVSLLLRLQFPIANKVIFINNLDRLFLSHALHQREKLKRNAVESKTPSKYEDRLQIDPDSLNICLVE